MKYRKFFFPILAAGVLAISACSSGESKDDSVYQNPVFEPVFADPSIIKGEDGHFYAYGTEDDWGDGEGSKYIPILKSADLTDWKHIGNAFSDQHHPMWKQGGLWAPEITFYNNKYYLYYSLSTWGDYDPGIGVATSDSAEGPFQDQGKVFRSTEIGVENSIDPFFIEENGTPYLLVNRGRACPKRGTVPNCGKCLRGTLYH